MHPAIKKLLALVGNLSKPSKMPCHSYSLSALTCPMRRIFGHITGSVCSRCYGCRGNYLYSSPKQAMANREAALLQSQDWAKNMVNAITATEMSGYFRWHDSGELLSVEHLEKIVAIAKATPDIKHWLPTRNLVVLSRYFRAGGKIPKNLTVRISATFVDKPLTGGRGFGLPRSFVGSKKGIAELAKQTKAKVCTAPDTFGQCGQCRDCWGKNPIIYHLH
jgi:hypothetical protein